HIQLQKICPAHSSHMVPNACAHHRHRTHRCSLARRVVHFEHKRVTVGASGFLYGKAFKGSAVGTAVLPEHDVLVSRGGITSRIQRTEAYPSLNRQVGRAQTRCVGNLNKTIRAVKAEGLTYQPSTAGSASPLQTAVVPT